LVVHVIKAKGVEGDNNLSDQYLNIVFPEFHLAFDKKIIN